MGIGFRQGAMSLFMLGLLAGCFRLDTETEVRALLQTWVRLAQTRDFTSRPTCTAAIFDTLSTAVLRDGPVQVATDLRAGVKMLTEGRPVAFDLPGQSPNAVSERVMSLDLANGLGLISSFVGPARACMDDRFQADVHYALMSSDTILIYDPSHNALMLLHRPTRIAFYLRGNV